MHDGFRGKVGLIAWAWFSFAKPSSTDKPIILAKSLDDTCLSLRCAAEAQAARTEGASKKYRACPSTHRPAPPADSHDDLYGIEVLSALARIIYAPLWIPVLAAAIQSRSLRTTVIGLVA